MELLIALVYVASRYLHIVGTALILGGTLFYLWVVPFAIEELKDESQIIVFARARVIFRWIVFTAAIFLLITGAVMTARSMWVYRGQQIPIFREMALLSHPQATSIDMLDHPGIFDKPALWFYLHVVVALLGLFIAVALVRGGRPPQAPLLWMRRNLLLLLIAILFAVLSRNARQRLFESIKPVMMPAPSDMRE